MRTGGIKNIMLCTCITLVLLHAAIEAADEPVFKRAKKVEEKLDISYGNISPYHQCKNKDLLGGHYDLMFYNPHLAYDYWLEAQAAGDQEAMAFYLPHAQRKDAPQFYAMRVDVAALMNYAITKGDYHEVAELLPKLPTVVEEKFEDGRELPAKDVSFLPSVAQCLDDKKALKIVETIVDFHTQKRACKRLCRSYCKNVRKVYIAHGLAHLVQEAVKQNRSTLLTKILATYNPFITINAIAYAQDHDQKKLGDDLEEKRNTVPEQTSALLNHFKCIRDRW